MPEQRWYCLKPTYDPKLGKDVVCSASRLNCALVCAELPESKVPPNIQTSFVTPLAGQGNDYSAIDSTKCLLKEVEDSGGI